MEVRGDQTGCSPCLPAMYSNDLITGMCEFCFEGAYAEAGSINCTNCPAGKTSYNNYDCVTCHPGTYSPNETVSCISCPVNTYSNTFGASECKQCPEGMTTNGSVGQTSCKCSLGCVDCIIEKNSEGKEIEKCKECLPGYAFMNGKCVVCEAGYYSEGGVSVCEVCPDLTWSYQGWKQCLKCLDNTLECDQTNSFSNICYNGYYRSYAATCEPCEPGTYLVDGSKGKCIKCDNMMYTDKNASTSCKPCDSTCTSCDRRTGYCKTCNEGFIITNYTCNNKTFITRSTITCSSITTCTSRITLFTFN